MSEEFNHNDFNQRAAQGIGRENYCNPHQYGDKIPTTSPVVEGLTEQVEKLTDDLNAATQIIVEAGQKVEALETRNAELENTVKVATEFTDYLVAKNEALQSIVDGLLQPTAYGIDSLTTLTYELGRYGADTESRRDAMVNAVEMAIQRLRAKGSTDATTD